jgi:aspartyl-tRNA(Asn)/glutamyl-tRNA(Gln) amidotransferase subunit B
VEVKNLNSFKSVESAIEYEVNRQIESLENGKELVQETRGWDEVKLRTFSQRSKETAKDYRYFPDPDIPKIKVSEHEAFSTTRLDEIMPKLPNETRILYQNLGLASSTTEVLLANIEIDAYFKSVLERNNNTEVAKLAANYLTSDVLPIIQSDEYQLTDLKSEHYEELMSLIHDKKIGSRVAKDLLPELFGSTSGPLELATERNLLQVSDASSLKTVIDEIINENSTVVEEYKGGKEASLKFLLGQGMKKTKGSADPKVLEGLLIDTLK